MKAFCFVGSNSLDSVGKRVSLLLEKKLNSIGISTFFHCGRNTNVSWCVGCSQCFKTGKCPEAEKDDMGELKKEMKRADIIIWISPVYGVNVSGMMKNYLDRITSWMHTCDLAGKLGVVVSVSSGSGLEFTAYYMKKMLLSMGCNVIGEHHYSLNGLKTKEEIAEDVLTNLKQAIESKQQYANTKELEENFQKLKKGFTGMKENTMSSNAYEIAYWNQIAKLGCDTFESFIRLKTITDKGDVI